MEKKLILVVAALAAAFTAQAVTINFEGFPHQTEITNQYAGLGITFSGGAKSSFGLSNGDPGNWGLEGTNGPDFLGNNGTGVGGKIIRMDFVAGQNNFGFDISRANGSSAGDQFKTRVYDINNNMALEQTWNFNNINQWGGFGWIGFNLYGFEIEAISTGFSPFGIDNVSYDAVPEPATLGLLAMAGFGLIAKRRKQKS